MRTGKIIQVSGSVVDVRFPHGELPRIREALSVELNGKRLVMEVEQHLSAETVRCIMLSGSEGLSRGMTVTGEGSGLRVPRPQGDARTAFQRLWRYHRRRRADRRRGAAPQHPQKAPRLRRAEPER